MPQNRQVGKPPRRLLKSTRKRSKSKQKKKVSRTRSKSNSKKVSRKKSRSKQVSRKKSKSKKVSRQKSKSKKVSRQKSKSKKVSRKRSKTRSKKVSRKKSKSKKVSRQRSKTRSKKVSRKKPRYAGRTEICVPAGNRMINQKKVMFRPSFVVTVIRSKDYSEIEKVKKEVEVFVKKNVAPDNIGLYLVKFSKIEAGGKGKVKLLGPIEKFQVDLHEHLKTRFGELISNQSEALVDVKGNRHAKLYPAFNLLQLTVECE